MEHSSGCADDASFVEPFPISSQAFGHREAWVKPPRLPLPALRDTCRNYLAIAEPLFGSMQFAQTRAAVEAFLIGEGPDLQHALEELDEQATESYLHDIWLDLYLSNRAPLAMTQNVAGGFHLPPRIARMPLGRKAAQVAFAAALFLRDAEMGRLPQDRQAGRPLCMMQYRHLSGTTRTPFPGADRLRHAPMARHCVVAWRGGFFVLPLMSGEGLRDPALLHADIRAILDCADTAPPVGLLTGLPRDEWAEFHRRLSRDAPGSLEAIEDAAFILCIDDRPSGKSRSMEELMTSWFAGAKNRWFDKMLQIIVSDAPAVGCNMEHSPVDGMTLDHFARFCRRIFDRGGLELQGARRAAPARPLAWGLPATISSSLRRLERETAAASIGLQCLEIDVPGLRASVNTAVHLALQLASHKVLGRIDNIYMPVHMRYYHAGRTEGAHPVTRDTLAACMAMSAGVRADALRPLVASALRDISRRALMARRRGVDRHLLGLQRMAEAARCRPAIFADPAYAALIGPAQIATSTMPAGGLDIFGFAPARADGFGVACVAGESKAVICVSAWGGRPEEFSRELRNSIACLVAIHGSAEP